MHPYNRDQYSNPDLFSQKTESDTQITPGKPLTIKHVKMPAGWAQDIFIRQYSKTHGGILYEVTPQVHAQLLRLSESQQKRRAPPQPARSDTSHVDDRTSKVAMSSQRRTKNLPIATEVLTPRIAAPVAETAALSQKAPITQKVERRKRLSCSFNSKTVLEYGSFVFEMLRSVVPYTKITEKIA
ncbi:MAG: hypothetical protein H0X51_01755 [Parachlamydiaceae bacterium]|nr:hypothetical protein [Parachlamydiaceae bacterium]